MRDVMTQAGAELFGDRHLGTCDADGHMGGQSGEGLLQVSHRPAGGAVYYYFIGLMGHGEQSRRCLIGAVEWLGAYAWRAHPWE
ncbi:hypothetical protein CTU88_40565 [Streptomyces sp. JV178]|nr:hypothetical protein [Streptomyces sp. JV178]PIM66865.1 hypothetical protein CTU88_40565 [Streptomyces sp. JV178]